MKERKSLTIFWQTILKVERARNRWKRVYGNEKVLFFLYDFGFFPDELSLQLFDYMRNEGIFFCKVKFFSFHMIKKFLSLILHVILFFSHATERSIKFQLVSRIAGIESAIYTYVFASSRSIFQNISGKIVSLW